jgi:histidine phosphotransfer protein HptB
MSALPPNRPPVAPVTLDAGAIARLRDLDPEGRLGVLPRVLTAFEASLGRMLSQLGAEGDAAQAASVASLAHTLKSSSASVGALRLSAACEDIERRTRGSTGPAQHHDVQRLIAEGEAALEAVRAILRP